MYITEIQQSPLMLAAANGHSRCVRRLLAHGADVLEKDEKGYNCLMRAIENKHRYENDKL